VSQRHLNSIKSIFGGIRNWWSGEGKKDDVPPTSGPMSRDRQQLRQTIASTSDRSFSSNPGTHPALRLRSDDVKGFYDEDVVEFGAATSCRSDTSRAATSDYSGRQAQSTSASSRSAEWQQYEKSLNANLGTKLSFYLLSSIVGFMTL
jgi:hypothetical protein